jgi:hypothetical protein
MAYRHATDLPLTTLYLTLIESTASHVHLGCRFLLYNSNHPACSIVSQTTMKTFSLYFLFLCVAIVFASIQTPLKSTTIVQDVVSTTFESSPNVQRLIKLHLRVAVQVGHLLNSISIRYDRRVQ